MNRIARLILAISASSGGLVLIDEIETGLHHSVLPKVWKVIDKVANECDAQIIATTHSYECVQAAGQSLADTNSFLLHRLEANGLGNRCVTYQPNDIATAIRHDFEVR